jgi:Sulfotransferase family
LTPLAALRRDRALAPAPFVVGVGRSGTTLLRLMLDAHPQLAIGAETQFVGELIDRAEAGASTAELVELVVESRTWADFGLEPEALRERAGSGGEIGAAGVLRAFYGLCAEARGKPRWGDKTPGYVKRMRPIASTLPEARFVHLIRDGRDVALSRLARGMGAEKSIGEIAALWQRRIENARRQAKRLRGRYLELRYEDLVAAPEQPLRRVCELIELEYDAAMLSYHEDASERLSQLGDLAAERGRRERPGSERLAAHALAAEPPSAARTGAWRTEMSERDRAAFKSVAGPLLRELGYDVPS